MPTTSALHLPNQLSVTRFESCLPSLDRWGHHSGHNRFLRHRPRNGWKKRSQEQAAAPRVATRRRQEQQPSLLRQSVEIGLFGTYMLIFMASLWILG